MYKSFNSIEQYIEWLNSREYLNNEYTIENIQSILEMYDNPQDKIRTIHIAGTNGKGSTCKYITEILSTKYNVGLFISPYIDNIYESIQYNGNYISGEDFCNIIDDFMPKILELDKKNKYLTSFEILTAIMFKYFFDKKVDFAIIEVGLGGTFDATNIIKKPLATVITSISMDHMNILGNNIRNIAKNKAGIIKNNIPVFLYPQKFVEAEEVIRETAKNKNCEVITFSQEDIHEISINLEFNSFKYKNYIVKTSLVGVHQILNASLAITVVEYYNKYLNLTREDIIKGLLNTSHGGRFEIINLFPTLIIDGAHNEDAIDMLIESIKKLYHKRIIIGFSMLKDKNYLYSIKRLSEISETCFITSINNPRTLDIDILEKETKKYFMNVYKFSDLKSAINRSIKIADKDDLVVWCGSLYLVKDIKKIINKIDFTDVGSINIKKS